MIKILKCCVCPSVRDLLILLPDSGHMYAPLECDAHSYEVSKVVECVSPISTVGLI